MSELIRYRDDVEWPLNEAGRQFLIDEGIMHSPTVYDPELHHVDPATLNPFGGNLESQLHEVLAVMLRRYTVRNEGSGAVIPCFVQGVINQYFGVNTPEQGAESVRADDPGLHPTRCRQWLLDQGAKIRPGIFRTEDTDFSNGPPAVTAVMDAMPYLVSPTAFAVKYYYGLARPEQIVRRALAGTIEVPDWFHDALAGIGLDGTSTGGDVGRWFQYPHPPHPDYIAMHAAVAAFGYVARVMFELTPTQDDAVIDYMEQVAHNRDTGGVHTWTASHDGFARVGLAAIKVELPRLVNFLGGNGDYVSELLEGM